MRNVFADYQNRQFAWYFCPDFFKKHLNMDASPNSRSAYEMGKSLSHIGRQQLFHRNTSPDLSSTAINSVIVDGAEKQVLRLMWEVERCQPNYGRQPLHFSEYTYLISMTKDKAGRQSKDRIMRLHYGVRRITIGNQLRFVVNHLEG